MPPFVDSAVLLSWHGSLLTDFSSFCKAIAQLTAWHWAEGRKTERCPLTIHISPLLIIMRLYWRVIINSTVSNNEVSIHWNNSYRPKALGDSYFYFCMISVKTGIGNIAMNWQLESLTWHAHFKCQGYTHTHPHTHQSTLNHSPYKQFSSSNRKK